VIVGTQVASLALVALALSACAAATASVQRFEQSRVEVSVRYEPTRDGGQLVATFTPTEQGLHFYGSDLPMTGIDGAGRPTRIDLVDGRWRAAGDLSESVQPELRAMPGFDEPFPMYPAGPLTIRLPVVPSKSGDAPADVHIQVTLMACSQIACFRPVVAHPMRVAAR